MRNVLLLLLLGCATSTREVPLGEPFTLTPGESAMVDGVRITFERVGQDSRCPPDVTCIWAGDAEVKLTVGGVEVTLHTHGGTQYPGSASVAGRTITLKELSRAPYNATLVVTRLST